MTQGRWSRRPPDSNWGDYGPHDELGRLNDLTADHVRRAAAEIVTGERFGLSLPLDYPGGQVLSRFRQPPCHACVIPEDGIGRFNYPDSRNDGFTDIESDDLVILHTQYSTHWDGLAHIGGFFDANADGAAERVYYNGFRAGTDVVPPQHGQSGSRLGLEHAAAIGLIGRGVLIDLAAHIPTGNGPVAVGFDALDQIRRSDSIAVERGDILCIHTGFADRVLAMQKSPDVRTLNAHSIGLDGRDQALLNWITASGVVAIAADNFAVETWPARPPETLPASELPLHEHCLFKLGILLGELWHLGPLAQALRAGSRSRFFLSASPLRLPGPWDLP